MILIIMSRRVGWPEFVLTFKPKMYFSCSNEFYFTLFIDLTMPFTKLMPILWLCVAIIGGDPTYSDDIFLLSELTHISQNACPSQNPSCGREGIQKITPCCGKCDCEANCREYGSCCLSEYASFSQAQESIKNSR